MKKLTINAPGDSKPIGAYSPAIAVRVDSGDQFLFITGQVATDEAGTVLAPGDPAGQAEVVFGRISALLSAAGGDMHAVVSVTIYVTSRALFEEVSAVRNRWLSEARPSSTMVVAELMEAGCLVEISAVAVVARTTPPEMAP